MIYSTRLGRMKKVFLMDFLFEQSFCLGNVLLFTLPKTGTNLVLKLLRIGLSINDKTIIHNVANISQDTDSKQSIHWGHLWKLNSDPMAMLDLCDAKIKILEKRDTKVVLLLRDPRQHIIALLRSVRKPINSTNIQWGIRNFSRLLALQTGSKDFLQYSNMNECYERYLDWLRYSNVYITSFERLVGPKGGGSLEVQIEEIIKLINFLGECINKDEAKLIAEKLFGGTPTFKEGQIASWRKHYSPEDKILFKEMAGELLIKLGYEKDFNW